MTVIPDPNGGGGRSLQRFCGTQSHALSGRVADGRCATSGMTGVAAASSRVIGSRDVRPALAYMSDGPYALMSAKPLKSPDPQPPFWETKTLSQMTAEEWESLCDGCGRCCLIRFEDEDTGEVVPTRVSCRLLDTQTCRCTRYRHRKRYVPDCIKLTPQNVGELKWMPPSCAYRRIWEGKGLASWHPLVSGDPTSVARAGIGMQGQLIPETELDRPEDAIAYEAPDLLDDGGD